MTPAKGKRKTLFFCVSDPAVYEALQVCLRAHLPKSVHIAFLGNPLDDWRKFPVEMRRRFHTTSRLLLGWVLVNDFIVRKLGAAMNHYDVVVVQGFGLNAYLKAVAYHDCRRVLKYQSRIIEACLKDENLPAPEYVLRKPTDARVARAISDYFTNLKGQEDPHWFGTYDHVEKICHTLTAVVCERLHLPKAA